MTLSEKMRRAWSKETAFLPEEWSGKNPARGQCAITAAVVQDELGGEIIKCEVTGEGFKHFYNQLPSGEIIDLTRDQFSSDVPFENEVVADRAKMLAYPGSQERYEKLKANLVKYESE